jgi:ubiquinol-cytochrome c reductase cytochrome b subunit
MLGDARWITALGGAMVWIFALEILSGFALGNLYAPTSRDAWASIVYLESAVPVGALVRGFHYWLAQLMVVLSLCYALAIAASGQHRRPREGMYWSALLIMGLVIGLAHTGALLPWDERAFWIAKVEDGIIGTFPVIGAAGQRALRNGPELGTPTLTRMYALHTTLLPLAFALILYWRAVMQERHGVGQSTAVPEDETTVEGSRSFPSQTLRDLAVAAALAIVALIVAKKLGAPLDGPADPDRADYPARPEWYLLWLYRLRMMFEGKNELIATAIIPAIGTGILLLAPLADRTKKRLGVGQVLICGTLSLLAGYTAYSVRADTREAAYVRGRTAADTRAITARRFAADGVGPEGPQDLLRSHPSVRPRLLYEQHCVGCHAPITVAGRDARGQRTNARGPVLEGFGSRAWARAVMVFPNHPALFGRTTLHGMPPQRDLDEGDLSNLAEYLYAQSVEGPDPAADVAKVRLGSELFHNTCTICHQGDGDLSGTDAADRTAPDLTNWASTGWIRQQILQPAHTSGYGTANEMPGFADELQGRDLEMIVRYVRSLRDRAAPPVQQPPPPESPANSPDEVPTSADAGSARD